VINKNRKYAVVLFNLGGPDSLDAIEPFLFNLFCDPDIFKIPFGQKYFAGFISKRRAPKVAEEYKLIGGNSPINKWTEAQRVLLENELKNISDSIDVYTSMRYWKPSTKETAAQIEANNYDKIILLPLYPHYSITTTGSSFNEWSKHYKNDKSKLIYIKDYYTHPKYIEALNKRIDETLLRFPESVRNDVRLVFSAHGTPVSLVKKGDPYSKQISETIKEVVRERNFSHQYHLCYQSKVGPMKWLEPSTDSIIKELASKGQKHLLIIPISFVSDHVETLFELDIEYRHIADKVGIENYIVMYGLNDSPIFIDTLKELVLEHL
jgi:ferrochelatase